MNTSKKTYELLNDGQTNTAYQRATVTHLETCPVCGLQMMWGDTIYILKVRHQRLKDAMVWQAPAHIVRRCCPMCYFELRDPKDTRAVSSRQTDRQTRQTNTA